MIRPPITYEPPPGERLLVASGDASYVLSVQVALDAHGIPHREEGPSGWLWFPNRVIVHSADYERAKHAIKGLQETKTFQSPAETRRFVRFVIFAVVVLALSLIFIVISR